MRAVFFHLRNGVSYRNSEEIVTERGVDLDHATLIRDDDGDGIQLMGWHESEQAIMAKWIKVGCYRKSCLALCVSELVPLFSFAASGLSMAYLARNLSDRYLDLRDPAKVCSASEILADVSLRSSDRGNGPTSCRISG